MKEVYEGEVTELNPVEIENALESGGGKSISHVVIGLKTIKGSKQLKLDPSIYESMQKEKVNVGDVIYIESSTGAVKVRSLAVDFHLSETCLKACRAVRLFCHGIRPGGRGIRPAAEG